VTSGAEQPVVGQARRPHRPSLDEQAAAKGTQPIGDGSFYAREELFADPGELEEFLAFLYESRGAGTA
jgi:hypothetical protein